MLSSHWKHVWLALAALTQQADGTSVCTPSVRRCEGAAASLAVACMMLVMFCAFTCFAMQDNIRELADLIDATGASSAAGAVAQSAVTPCNGDSLVKGATNSDDNGNQGPSAHSNGRQHKTAEQHCNSGDSSDSDILDMEDEQLSRQEAAVAQCCHELLTALLAAVKGALHACSAMRCQSNCCVALSIIASPLPQWSA